MQMFSPTRKNEPAAPSMPESPANGAAPIYTPPPPPRPVATRAGGVLSSGVSITGSLKFSEEFEIDGELEGSIDSTGRLNIGKNARVRGEVRVGSVTVHGTVDGNVTATER